MSDKQSLRRQFTVYGYMRRMEKNYAVFHALPLPIVGLIVDFYHLLPEFSWNPEECGSLMHIDGNVLQNESLGWSICTSNVCLSPDIVDWYEFEIELHKWPLDAHPACMVGFVLFPAKKSIQKFDNFLAQSPETDHYVVNICKLNYFRLYGKNTECVDIHAKMTTDFKTGDRVKLRLDFVARQMTLYYNGEFVAHVFQKNIPIEPMLPAVALSECRISFVGWSSS